MIIDMHTHILPGLDDGAMDMKDSLELARMAVESGTEMLVATPHANQIGRFENYFGNALKERFFTFERTLKENNIPLRVFLGMEIYAYGNPENLQKKIEEKSLIGLNGTDYYLVEFPFKIDSDYIERVQDAIFDVGGIPLIAHPERYSCVQNEPGLVYEWLKTGASIQVNKGSVFGRYGEVPKHTALTLFDHDLVTIVASDAHDPRRRTTWMTEIETFLKERYGEAYAKRLLFENPVGILRNEDIPMHGYWRE